MVPSVLELVAEGWLTFPGTKSFMKYFIDLSVVARCGRASYGEFILLVRLEKCASCSSEVCGLVYLSLWERCHVDMRRKSSQDITFSMWKGLEIGRNEPYCVIVKFRCPVTVRCSRRLVVITLQVMDTFNSGSGCSIAIS